MKRNKRYVAVILSAFALLCLSVACEPAPPPATAPPSTTSSTSSTTTTTTPQQRLQSVVEAVWAPGSLPRGSNVVWAVGSPPAPYAAYTSWSCFLWLCNYTVVVMESYITPAVIAHEGGHIYCVSTWGDGSEQCATNIATGMGY
jgi:hypothetical protein